MLKQFKATLTQSLKEIIQGIKEKSEEEIECVMNPTDKSGLA